MSNLESAKAAIKAELSHAKEGLTFYQSRIEALEKTLSHLASVSGSSDAPPVAISTATKRLPKVADGKPVKLVKGKKAGKESIGGNGLPFTGGDYWSNLVIEQPRAASEILGAAIGKLGFTPTKTQIQKLAGRMTFALNALVKTKKIQDSGSGRERRFFKA
jgi:hypothetical protein